MVDKEEAPILGLSYDPLILRNLLTEVRLIVKIYNECWAQNWGFLPITDEEAITLTDSLRMVADPGLN